MLPIDSCNLKISLPLLFFLFIVAQIDLASAAGWPPALLALLHLMPAPDDLCRGVCSGIGVSIDAIVIFQFARILARRSFQPVNDSRRD
ncbi:MAG: hypothetical protein WBP85_11415 [Terracidiphilus sp.]